MELIKNEKGILIIGIGPQLKKMDLDHCFVRVDGIHYRAEIVDEDNAQLYPVDLSDVIQQAFPKSYPQGHASIAKLKEDFDRMGKGCQAMYEPVKLKKNEKFYDHFYKPNNKRRR